MLLRGYIDLAKLPLQGVVDVCAWARKCDGGAEIEPMELRERRRNGGREGGDGAGEGPGGMEEDCNKVVHFFETQASFTGLSNKTTMRWIITIRLGALPLPPTP